MMEIERIIGRPPSSGRFKDQQIAQMSTWTAVPEDRRIISSVAIIHMDLKNGSTETRINPTDPGDGYYLERPYPVDRVLPAGKMVF